MTPTPAWTLWWVTEIVISLAGLGMLVSAAFMFAARRAGNSAQHERWRARLGACAVVGVVFFGIQMVSGR